MYVYQKLVKGNNSVILHLNYINLTLERVGTQHHIWCINFPYAVHLVLQTYRPVVHLNRYVLHWEDG